jgi:cystathionine beta-synthase
MHTISKKKITEFTGLIGNTPMVKLRKIAAACQADIYAKLEMYNPGGSIKDRLALSLIEAAEKQGKLKPGGTVIEVTSGNTGIAVAMICALKNYRNIIVMSDKNSEEKQNMMRLYGAELVLTPHTVPPEDPRSNYSVAERLAMEIPDSVYLDQYNNPANIDCHYCTTAPEIWEQMAGDIDCIVAGAGTGGTISGIGRFFKEKNSATKIIGVDPEGSMLEHLYRTGQVIPSQHYEVEGIGSDKVVRALDMTVLDDMITVSDRESFMLGRQITLAEGIFCGGSSGSVLAAAYKAIEKYNIKGNVVIILADSGDRYLSKMYSDKWMKSMGYL